VVQIVTLTGTLAHTSEDGVTTVSLGDVVDELLNEHSLADTGTTEQTNFSTTGVGGEQIDDLDTSDENLSGGGLLNELWGVVVDRQELVRLDGATLIDGVTSDVYNTAESGRADGNGDGSASVGGLGASGKTLGTCSDIHERKASTSSAVRWRYVPSMAMQRTTFSPRCCCGMSVKQSARPMRSSGSHLPKPRGRACCQHCPSSRRSKWEEA
jgi:hypothetical protein